MGCCPGSAGGTGARGRRCGGGAAGGRPRRLTSNKVGQPAEGRKRVRSALKDRMVRDLGRALGLAARENGLRACGAKDRVPREAYLCKTADAQHKQEEGGWRVSQPPYHRLGSAQDPTGDTPAGGP